MFKKINNAVLVFVCVFGILSVVNAQEIVAQEQVVSEVSEVLEDKVDEAVENVVPVADTTEDVAPIADVVQCDVPVADVVDVAVENVAPVADVVENIAPVKKKWFEIKFKKGKKVEKKQPENKILNETKKNDFASFLGLSDEQKAQYEQIRHEEFEEISPIVTKIKQKHEEIENLLHTSLSSSIINIEEGLIKRDIRVLKDEIHAIKVKNEEKIEAILNDEQKEKYAKFKAEIATMAPKQTVSRDMSSVSTTGDFVFKPCPKEQGACKIEDLKKE